jgi:5-methylcytosine-specific restriction endonuclease McrA
MLSKKVRRYRPWKKEDVAILREMYGKSPQYLIMAALPGRSWQQIYDAASRFGLSVLKPGRLSREEVLKRKREGMRRQREDAEKRDEINARNRRRYRDSEEVRKDCRRDAVQWRERHFFTNKCRGLRRLDKEQPPLKEVTAKDLWSLWKRQRGRCALTGRKLDRHAHVDHKIPRSRGGSGAIENLQWLSAYANYLKRHLTDEEFISLCRDVIAWADRGIPLTSDPVLREAFPNPIDSNKARWKGRRLADTEGLK